jgi:tRNA threonylcarbamoyladenosine biosynthesis protein TsaE
MMTKSDTQSVETVGPAETFAVAEALGRQLAGSQGEGSPVLLVLLRGELGVGKTVFAKGLAAGLGVADVDDVASPTFTLVDEHPLSSGRTFHHVDLYRIEDPDECEGIGLREIFARDDGSICAVEWAENVDGTAWDLTRHSWWFRVTIVDLGEDRRRITVEAGESLAFTEQDPDQESMR